MTSAECGRRRPQGEGSLRGADPSEARERSPASDRRGAALGEERGFVLGQLVSADESVRARQAALALEVGRLAFALFDAPRFVSDPSRA